MCKRRTNGATEVESKDTQHPCFRPSVAPLRLANIGNGARCIPWTGLDPRHGAWARQVWFWRKWWPSPRLNHCAFVSRLRIRFVALCVGLDTDMETPPPARTRTAVVLAGGCAATFLKHKLWRNRNTGRWARYPALCLALQVIDRTAISPQELALARLLLVGTTGTARSAANWAEKCFSSGAPFNED